MTTRWMTAALGVTLAWSLACSGSTTETPDEGEAPPAEDPTPAPEPAPAPAPATVTGTGTKEDPFVVTCDTKARDLPAWSGETFAQCPDACLTASVWGTCDYTFDSSLCTAANHSGALAGAGLVKVTKEAGLESYKGSAANGVTSRDWGSFSDTLTFGRMTGECAEAGGGGGGGGGGGRKKRPAGGG